MKKQIRKSIAIATVCDASSATLQRNLASLRKLGMALEVLCWDRLRKHATLVTRQQGTTYRAVLKGGGLRNLRVIVLLPLWWAGTLWRLLLLRSSLMFAHNFEAAVPVWLASKLRNRPYIYHIHDNITLSHQFWAPIKRILDCIDERFIRDAHSVIVPDECRILPYAEQYRPHIQVLPNVFPMSANEPSRMERSASGVLTILALGSLRLDRGIGILLEATRDLRGVKVLLAGHTFDPEIDTAIRSHTSVEYRGLLSSKDALKLYGEGDLVFIFYEPCVELNIRAAPIKLGESLMMGVPVVINSEVLVSSRIADEWMIGYRCPYDANALRELLKSLRDDIIGREARALRARSIYNRHFRWEPYEKIFLESVRRVVRGGESLTVNN